MLHELKMVYLHWNGSFEAVETYLKYLPKIEISTFKIIIVTFRKEIGQRLYVCHSYDKQKLSI